MNKEYKDMTIEELENLEEWLYDMEEVEGENYWRWWECGWKCKEVEECAG